ncbi:hypothetical protein NOR_08298 [Metarhizium rileyi]|uniref:Secreted protein n=1 Tax=Metarhizium rileyi (strain RCEF 4871) TaxID=1649241 RepID=A0A166WJ30_METRR|nr:hypothetical protein NOR_08298 [Metarhizium rileyi RCEF 4871]
MKLSVASIAAALLSVVNGLPNNNTPYKLDPRDAAGAVTWTGEVLPGKNVTFTGTMQEVRHQITAENPDYFAEFANSTDLEIENHLERRWTLKQPPDCEYGHYMRRIYAIQFINELKAKGGGKATCGAPPRRANGQGGCSRVSCNWGSQMWLCNDNDYHLQLPCTEVASALLELSNVCYTIHEGGDTQTQGQLFTTGNWNVIMTYFGDCHSPATVS